MNCRTMPAYEFAESHMADYVREHLTHPGSDFNKKLASWANGLVPADADGVIAVVVDHGKCLGWARTERWCYESGTCYDTLEAFVDPDHRLCGIAALASAAIYADVLHENGGTVAVFHPHMLLVARRAGFWPDLFERDGGGGWRRA